MMALTTPKECRNFWTARKGEPLKKLQTSVASLLTHSLQREQGVRR